MTLPIPVRDVAILLARIGIGIVFFAHGWQKLVTNGVDGTAAFFGQAGVPLPTLSAWFATLVELVGGAALIVGAGVTVAGLLLALNMAGALLFVHASNGLFADQGGYEFVLTLGLASLLLAAVGAGRLSVDHLLFGRRASAAADTATTRA
ncbi:DoxX family protein [Micromonospora sp. KC606]|uniref:DoxX family protein n=1 Tax=Micromonospora sp. KC606 TaxID=2530379 RepID=UPI001047C48A|nr:DoxX family protein [Micromonospora sp. KC606]TDC85190.1 DoxX family protein [Micromonospora sp. KC606]